MGRRITVLMGLLLVLGLPSAAVAEGAEGGTSDPPLFLEDQLSVRIASLLDPATRRSFEASRNISQMSMRPQTGWGRYKIEDGAPAFEKAGELRTSGMVLDAIPIALGELAAFPNTAPNDTRYPKQWGLPDVGMLTAWQIAGGGSPNHAVAIVDSGVDTNHPDLGNIISSCYVPNCTNVEDGCEAAIGGHGTKVAGIAAAFTNNDRAIAGVAYNAPIMSLKVSVNCGGVDVHAASEAIVDAVDAGAWAITTSWVVGNISELLVGQLYYAIDYAWDRNVPVVAAAGNDDGTSLVGLYPASWQEVITVGGTMVTSQGTRRWRTIKFGEQLGSTYNFQCCDPGIDIVAPAGATPTVTGGIISTEAGGGVIYDQGTSYAVPLVAGIVHLMKTRHATWNSWQILQRLRDTANKDSLSYYGYADSTSCNGYDVEMGCGVLDAPAAVQ